MRTDPGGGGGAGAGARAPARDAVSGFAVLAAYFGVSASIFLAFRLFLPELDLHLASLEAQAFAFLAVWIGQDFVDWRAPDPQKEAPPEPDPVPLALARAVVDPARPLRENLLRARWTLPLVVVSANALVGVALLRWLVGRVEFPTAAGLLVPVDTLVLVGGVLNVLVVQVGGWALQAFLVFCVVVLLDGKGELGYYLRLVGIAYVGYLLLSLALAATNPVLIPEGVEVARLEAVTAAVHPILGKVAEYWVLTLVAWGVMLRERFPPARCLVAAAGPSFLLLTSRLVYGIVLG